MEPKQFIIEQLSSDGRGIGRVDGRAVFVEHVLPGDEIRAQIHWNNAPPFAILREIVQPSALRCQHPCPHANDCVGSIWGHLNYAEQCAQKEQIVRHTLRGLNLNEKIHAIKASPAPWHYRQRVTLSVWEKNSKLEIGYKTEARATTGTAIRGCSLAHPNVERAVQHISRLLLSADPRTIRSLPTKIQIHRTASSAGALLMLPAPLMREDVQYWSRLLTAEQLSGGIWGVETSQAGLIGVNSRFMSAPNSEPMLTTWLQHELELHPAAFCQVNPAVADLICLTLREYFARKSFDRIWDLYGGWGMLGFSLVSDHSELSIFEVNSHAEAPARKLAASVRLKGLKFRSGDLLRSLPYIVEQIRADDLIILDPPKSGAHQDVIRAIGSSAASTLVYLSCNVAKLTRDLPMLKTYGFEIRAVYPFDMFPNTTSIEALVILER